jgi:hypothetical protein
MTLRINSLFDLSVLTKTDCVLRELGKYFLRSK